MERGCHASRMVRDHPRTTTSVGAVAEGQRERKPGRPTASRSKRSTAGGALFAGGRWNRGDSQRSAKIRSLVGALAALGPDDSSAKTELEGALKRAKAQESTPTRVTQMPELVQPATEWRGWNKQFLRWGILRGQRWMCWLLL